MITIARITVLCFCCFLCDESFSSPTKKDSGPVQYRKKVEQISKILHDHPNDAAQKLLDLLPTEKKEFEYLCWQSPKPACDNILIDNLKPLLSTESQYRRPLAIKIAKLASILKFESDGPDYVQDVWRALCLQQTKYFIEGLEALPTEQAQDRALKFLNEDFHEGDTYQFLSCVKKLREQGYEKWAKRAEKFHSPVKRVRH
ncbi:MAG: hypothetical protein HY537_05825 [Deltaproteobacteria bacterium]|nr:hypothetical protein [Deltaproteobacteria bacterium]